MANSFLDKTGLTYLWGKITALVSTKQDALTFDDSPTNNSSNPVKSGGVYTALSGKAASDHTQAVNKGGTNITSYTTGDILYASGSTTLSKLNGNTTTTKKFLKSVATTSGTATAPAWDTLAASDIPNLDWSKITSGKPTTLSGYGITDAAASDHTQAVNKGGTNITSYTTGDILYASGSTTLAKLAGNTTTTKKFLKSVATTSGTAVAPAWDTLAAADIPNLDWSKITSGKPTTLSGYGITDAAASGHTQAVDKGGTNIASYTKGDILYASAATTLSKLAIGTAGKFLKATADGPAWDSLPAASSSAAGIVKLGASGGAATYDHTHSGYVSKSGDTVNGVLVANNFVSKYGVEFQNSSGTNVGGIFQDMEGANQFYMDEYTTSGVRECYLLPTPDATATSFYDILTSKNAVTVAQGGTGATTAAGARTNLGLGSMAVASTADYVAKAGDTMTGVLRAPCYFSTDNGSTGYNGISFTSGSNVVKARIHYMQEDNVSSHLVFGQDSIDGTKYASFHLPEIAANEDYDIITTANAIISGFKTTQAGGYEIDQWGNFKHTSSTATNNFCLDSNAGAHNLQYTWETGSMTLAGNLITNGYIEGKNGVYATNGVLVSRAATAYVKFENASAQAIGEIWSQSGRIYIRERPSAGSSYITDIVFPTAKTNGNENVYVYTSRNFSLSGTTLTITVPS